MKWRLVLPGKSLSFSNVNSEKEKKVACSVFFLPSSVKKANKGVSKGPSFDKKGRKGFVGLCRYLSRLVWDWYKVVVVVALLLLLFFQAQLFAVCEAQFPSLFRYLPFVFCQCYCKQLEQAKATMRFSTLE